MKTLRFFPLAGLLLLFLLGQDSAGAQAGFSDSFHSTSLDDTLWAAQIGGRGSIDPRTDGLHMTLTADNSGALFRQDVWSRCKVQGDFDAQVEYRLTTWPPANGTRLGLGAWRSPAPPDFMGRWSEVGGPELYAALMADGTYATGTSDIAGRLRLARTGDTLAGYFYSSGTWVLLHSDSDAQYATGAFISLSIWGHNGTPGVEAVWENFSVTADAIACPGPFTPTYSMTIDDDAPGDAGVVPADDDCPVSAPCKIMYSLDIPDGQPSAGVLVREPGPVQEFAGDAIVPNGAIVGYLQWSRRVGPAGSCASGSVVTSQSNWLDATTDPTTTTGSPADLASFSHWPTQLNDLRDGFLTAFPGAVLYARWLGSSPTAVTNVLAYRLADGDIFYQATAGDPTVPASDETCGPVTMRAIHLGLSADNPDTPQNEAGIPLRTCAEAGTQTFRNLLDRDDTPQAEWASYDDTAVCSPNTPAGSGVSVPLNGGTEALAGIDLTYSNVTGGGATSVVTTTTGPPPPTGFKIVGLAELPLYFDINTDASYSGDLTVCVRYDETQVQGSESALRLMHRVGDNYVDVTTSVDTAANVICGTTTHLSIFVVAQPLPAVGGTMELRPDVSAFSAQQSDSALSRYMPLATAAAAGGAIAIAAGAWLARKRWRR
jgi:hypothetical protein